MIAFVAQKKFYHIKRDNMVLTDWMDDQSLLKQLNKMSFEEIIQMLKSELTHGGEVEELGNGLICVYKAGWSDNEHLVRLLISPFCIVCFSCQERWRNCLQAAFLWKTKNSTISSVY